MRNIVAATTAMFLLTSGAGAIAATTSCTTIAACLMGINTSAGYAVEGVSKANDAVVGLTTLNSTSASTGKAGVAGYDGSTNKTSYNSGVYGTSAYGYGVQGKSTSGLGVQGFSTSGAGVSGTSSSASGVSAYSFTGAGLFAVSPFGNGVIGNVDDGYGVYGESAYGAAVGALSYHPEGVAIQATSIYGDVFDGQNGSAKVAVIDNSGDLTLAGTLMANSTPNFRTTDSTGAHVVTYGDRSTSATLNDVGEASLTNGSAYVRLDPEFARTISQRSKYLVFITPEGDSHGLYTSTMTSQGFAVHENGGGRSALAFAYRIVARPLDDEKQLRLPSANIVPYQLGKLRSNLKLPSISKITGIPSAAR